MERYAENELISNRSAVLLAGGTEQDRLAWAEEAARQFEAEGPLRVVAGEADLTAALAQPRGVVFIPNVLSLSREAQGLLVRCLREREERPKLVIGLFGSTEDARAKGNLREDLHYTLQTGFLDLSAPGVRDAIKQRREKAARKAKPGAKPSAKKPKRR